MNDDLIDCAGILEKENAWWKNEKAHQKMRAKSTGRAYCSFCHHRRCWDAIRVHGGRALKKSKMCVYKTTKVDRCADMILWFINARNGEQFDI